MTLAALALGAVVAVPADTLRVGPDAPFPTVGAAVDAAPAHATIRVAPGVYRESTVILDRPLTLVGEPGAILDGEGERGLVVVTADSVTVTGLTFRSTGLSFTDDRAAVLVDQARFCRIENNRFEQTFFGVYLANTGDCVVADNVLETESERETRGGNGIHLWYSKGIEIRGNRVKGHRDGIYFEFVEDARVVNNESRENLRYGLHFMFSDSCTYRDNRFVENGAGVAVMYSRDVLMTGNDFDRNRGTAAFGLLLKDITDSRIEANRFRDNSVAIHAEGSNRLQVVGNDFLANGWAVQLMANSEDAAFEGNNFVGNTFDVATNSRRAYSTFSGNYWDRYDGWDLDHDGVGDVAHRPVRLFAFLVQRNRPTLVLHRSLVVGLLDLAERVFPLLTPDNLVDERPSLAPLATAWRPS